MSIFIWAVVTMLETSISVSASNNEGWSWLLVWMIIMIIIHQISWYWYYITYCRNFLDQKIRNLYPADNIKVNLPGTVKLHELQKKYWRWWHVDQSNCVWYENCHLKAETVNYKTQRVNYKTISIIEKMRY